MRPKVPKGYNPDYLHCRTFGHSWHVGNGESEGTAFYRFVLICNTCKTRRLEVVNRRTGSPGLPVGTERGIGSCHLPD